MRWLNYHHLYYFWHIAKAGSITIACRELRLSQPTLSAQLKTLETYIGEPLFDRDGRTLKLTQLGHLVYRYADEIFALGDELLDIVTGTLTTGKPLELRLGIADQIPKIIAYRLIEPALKDDPSIKIICEEDSVGNLLSLLATQKLDLVLSDSPIPSDIRVKAYNHSLGESTVSVVAHKSLARKLQKNFPQSLDGTPILLPLQNSALRREIDQWCEKIEVRPQIVGEFKDSALVKIFGEAGVGAFLVPTAVETEVCRQYRVYPAGRIKEIRERFYAISIERKVKHPAVVQICQSARGLLTLKRH